MVDKSPREKILKVAEQRFYAEGIRAVGVDTIIADAGVAKMSFYRQFKSKEGLVLEVLQRRDEQWREWLRETVERLAPDPKDRPLAVFDALAERFARKDYRGCAFINTMVETADRHASAHAAAAAHKHLVAAYLARLLREAGADERLAASFMILVDGAIVATVRDGTPAAATTSKAIASTLLRAEKTTR